MKSTGTSKAALVLQKSKVFQRAMLFTLLGPNANGNGAGYAGIQCQTNFDLSEFNNICLRCRAQGINNNYKMLLKHDKLPPTDSAGKKDEKNRSLVYGQVFKVKIASGRYGLS